jgi:hypothetical protein
MGPTVVIMFKAYFDDSSSDENDRILVLAGCVQSCKVWADFSISWEAALIRTPSIKYLHMRGARKLVGEFSRWKAENRDDKIRFLATVAESFRPWTIGAWVSRKEHASIMKPIAPAMINHAYFPLFYAVILKLAHWHEDMGIKMPVEYVFDDQGKLGDDAALWHRHIKSWQPPHVAALMGGTPRFEHDEWILPLQVADMLAWHLRRRKERPQEKLSTLPTSPLENLTYAEIHITEEWLAKASDQMKQVPNVELVQSTAKRIKKDEIRDVVRAMPTNREYER